MDDINITIGSKITKDDKSYRIIGLKNGVVITVELETTKLIFKTFDLMILIDELQTGFAFIEEPENDNRYFDPNSMTEDVKKNYELKKEIIADVIAKFGPTYIELKTKQGSDYAKEVSSKIDKKVFWKTVRLYFQSGFNENSLVDKRFNKENVPKINYTTRTGRPSKNEVIINSEIEEFFKEALKNYLSGRHKSYQQAYDEMILKHYQKIVEIPDGIKYGLVPVENRPTFRQFKYYCERHLSKADKDIAKTSRQEQRNNQRLLLSDNLKGVSGPGSLWEVDECEMDLFLVSEDDPSIVVGRPVVYAIIDVYTRMIVAYSVSFENNSVKGITNCLVNLVKDKKELCKEFGIDPTSIIWPHGMLPQRLRSDYGSEYISYEMERICKELNIQHELASPGTGSLKGQIEQLFHQIHSSINGVTEHNGLIEKRYDSTHKTNARLNIKEFESMLVGCIVAHNKQYMTDYPLTRKMMSLNVKPIPENLWMYGVKTNGLPRQITNQNLFRYTLLKPINVVYSRKGIQFKGLYYMNYEDDILYQELYSLGDRRVTIEAKIDPRSIDYIYTLRNNEIISIPLNEKKNGMIEFKGMNLADYEALYKQQAIERANGQLLNNEARIGLLSRNKAIMETAESVYLPSSKNLEINRAIEKDSIAKKHLIIEETIKSEVPEEKDTYKELSEEEAFELYESEFWK